MTKVKLIAKTAGVGEAITGQELISFIARVSNPSNQGNFGTASKLLKYLVKHQHWSPFEHAFMTVEIKTSRAIAQQILRHRSFTFQEFSQRYAEVLTHESYEARRQDFKNRQNSIDDLPESVKDMFRKYQEHIWNEAYSRYKALIDSGVAKEVARFILPLNTSTTIYMTGPVRSWIHYIDLRTDPSTQKEHRDIALAIREIFYQEFPDVAEAMWGNV